MAALTIAKIARWYVVSYPLLMFLEIEIGEIVFEFVH